MKPMNHHAILTAVCLTIAMGSALEAQTNQTNSATTADAQTTAATPDGFIVVNGVIYVIQQGQASVLPDSLRLGGTVQGINGFTQLIGALKPGFLLTIDGKMVPAPANLVFSNTAATVQTTPANGTSTSTNNGTDANGRTIPGLNANGTSGTSTGGISTSTSNGTDANGRTIPGLNANGTSNNGTDANGRTIPGLNANGTSNNGVNSNNNGTDANGRTIPGLNANGTSTNGVNSTSNGTGANGRTIPGMNANGTRTSPAPTTGTPAPPARNATRP